MSLYASALEQLHRAVTATPRTTDFVRPHPRLSAEQLLGLYQEGYHLRLQAAVRADYPALAHFLGIEDFAQLAADYVRRTPSHSYNLDRYSIGFASFLQIQRPDSAAADLAAIESAMTESFMHHDAPPLNISALAQMDETQLGAAQFTFQQSLRLLALQHDVEDYLAAFKRDAAPTTIATAPLYLMLTRQQHEVHRTRLSEAEYMLLQQLRRGATFDNAITQTCAHLNMTPESMSENIGAWLARWFQHGMIVALG